MGLPVDLRGSQPEPDAAGDRPPSQYLPVRRPCFTAGAGNADFDSGILLRQTGELRCVWWPARTEGGVSCDPHEVPWSAQPSVFDAARSLGANTALLEWFHPTCRVLNSLTYCAWWPLAMQHNSMGDGFWQVLPNQTRSLFETNLLSLFGRSLTVEQQTGVYRAMMKQAESLLGDRDFGFTLVHLPIPHAPRSE